MRIVTQLVLRGTEIVSLRWMVVIMGFCEDVVEPACCRAGKGYGDVLFSYGELKISGSDDAIVSISTSL